MTDNNVTTTYKYALDRQTAVADRNRTRVLRPKPTASICYQTSEGAADIIYHFGPYEAMHVSRIEGAAVARLNPVYESFPANANAVPGMAIPTPVLLSLMSSMCAAALGAVSLFIFALSGVAVIHPYLALIMLVAGSFLLTSNILAIRQ
jgi:hypothetical protein